MHKIPFMQEIRALPAEPNTPLTVLALQSLRRDVTLGVFEPGKKLKLDELQKSFPEVAVLNEFLASSQRGIIR